MAQKVADAIWTMLADAGVRRCYGIIAPPRPGHRRLTRHD